METENATIYGRLDVTIPEATYEAGKVSTVRILLRNPFDEPVEILEVQGPRSSHLQEIASQSLASNGTNETNQEESLGSKIKNNLIKGLSNIAFTEVSLGGIQVEFPRSEKTLNLSADKNSTIEIERELDPFSTVNIKAEEGAKVTLLQQKESPDYTTKEIITIEPHCEAVAYFNVSTTGWLFFTPTRQTLSTQIKYRIMDKERTQVVSSGFEIKPPLMSMVIGSIVGAGLGTLAKAFNMTQLPAWQPLLVSVGASMVMALIATISLSRKTGSQGFITVEDFFGGFVVGALIGYGGSEYFEKAIIPPSDS